MSHTCFFALSESANTFHCVKVKQRDLWPNYKKQCLKKHSKLICKLQTPMRHWCYTFLWKQRDMHFYVSKTTKLIFIVSNLNSACSCMCQVTVPRYYWDTVNISIHTYFCTNANYSLFCSWFNDLSMYICIILHN